MSSKTYAVVLTEHGTEQLELILGQWLRRNELGAYINCKSIDPNGPYFLMKLPLKHPSVVDTAMEVQIPHGFIKCILYAEDVKQVGFV